MKTKILIITNILTAIALLYCVIIYSGILDSRDNTATYPIKNSTSRDFEATFYYLDVLESENTDYSKETIELAPMTEAISGHDEFDVIKDRYRFLEIKEGETIVLTYSIPKEFNRKYTLDVRDNPLRIEVTPETEWQNHVQELEKKKSNQLENNSSHISSQFLDFILPKLISFVFLFLLFLGMIKKTIDLRINKKNLRTKIVFTILAALILEYLLVIASNFHLPTLIGYDLLMPAAWLTNVFGMCAAAEEFCISKLILFICMLFAYLSIGIYVVMEFIQLAYSITTKYRVNKEAFRSFLYTVFCSLFVPLLLLLLTPLLLQISQEYDAFFRFLLYLPGKMAQIGPCASDQSLCLLQTFLFIIASFVQLWFFIFLVMVVQKNKMRKLKIGIGILFCIFFAAVLIDAKLIKLMPNASNSLEKNCNKVFYNKDTMDFYMSRFFVDKYEENNQIVAQYKLSRMPLDFEMCVVKYTEDDFRIIEKYYIED
jgi:hypothetical protein